MNRRVLGLSFAFAPAIVFAMMALAPTATGQTSPIAKGKTNATATSWRTPDGQPDLQGVWSNATMTPLERPAALAGKAIFTDEELKKMSKEALEGEECRLHPSPRCNTDTVRTQKGTDADVSQAYNETWFERGNLLRQTSLIVDPENGKLPPLTELGEKIRRERMAAQRARGPADSWEDRSLQERCIVYHAVPPMPTSYNNNYEIVQTKGTVAILSEMIHEVRLIPLDGRPHLPSDVRQWLGDPRGHWEGNTLVVETTNFRDQGNLFRFPANPKTMRIVERFTRTDADNIDYRFTVDDPETYQKPWTAILPMTRMQGPIFEYACHEGNYGMLGILRGARADDEKAAAKPGSK